MSNIEGVKQVGTFIESCRIGWDMAETHSTVSTLANGNIAIIGSGPGSAADILGRPLWKNIDTGVTKIEFPSGVYITRPGTDAQSVTDDRVWNMDALEEHFTNYYQQKGKKWKQVKIY